jgi:hypothetical protein
MSNQALNQELRSLVDEFTNRLTLTVRRSVLEQIVAAMGGNVPNGRARATRRPARSAPARGGKRSSEQVAAMGAKLLSYVKSKPGRRGEQIAKVFHSDVKTIRLPMKQLIAAKKVRTKGQRRGMTYHAA